MIIKVLAVGDVVGESGLKFLTRKLHVIKKEYGIDFTIVNGENAAGIGLKAEQAERILGAGADCITLGNHTWGMRDLRKYLDECRSIVRPLNYAPQVPGRGYALFDIKYGRICVMNLIGRVSMGVESENPFFAAEKVIKTCGTNLIFCDMHAEATSEKLAMGYWLDGKASAVFGTHTHVQTSDDRVLPKGTGYITDLGMTGPEESVIGIKKELSINKFLGNPPEKYETADGKCKIECCIFSVDTLNGQCIGTERLRIFED